MKALQKFNDALGKWEFLLPSPVSDSKAKELIKNYRRWATEARIKAKYRVIKVILA